MQYPFGKADRKALQFPPCFWQFIDFSGPFFFPPKWWKNFTYWASYTYLMNGNYHWNFILHIRIFTLFIFFFLFPEARLKVAYFSSSGNKMTRKEHKLTHLFSFSKKNINICSWQKENKIWNRKKTTFRIN